jgi:TolB-like protein
MDMATQRKRRPGVNGSAASGPAAMNIVAGKPVGRIEVDDAFAQFALLAIGPPAFAFAPASLEAAPAISLHLFLLFLQVDIRHRPSMAAPDFARAERRGEYDTIMANLSSLRQAAATVRIARPLHVYRIPLQAEEKAVTPVAAPAVLALPDKPSLAVLPFANMSGDPVQEYFVDGMVEDITTAIARLPWLFVIARNSSFAYKGKSPDLRQVGRDLGVRYVLEGSVRKAGNRVRITGQLIDTTTGAHIWADRIDGALDDIFELQDQVASKVVGAIEPKLRLAEIRRASRKPTDSLDAYDLYLRALAQFHKWSAESFREATRLLSGTLSIDPSYAPAAALFGVCRSWQRANGWESLSDEEVAEAIGLAKQAVDTGKDDPDALWMAGQVIPYLSGEHAAALDLIERALALTAILPSPGARGDLFWSLPTSPNRQSTRSLTQCAAVRSIRSVIGSRRDLRSLTCLPDDLKKL